MFLVESSKPSCSSFTCLEAIFRLCVCCANMLSDVARGSRGRGVKQLWPYALLSTASAATEHATLPQTSALSL